MPEYSNYLESLDPVVGALSGDEIIGASKDGDAVSLTAQQIANLGGGGGGTWGSITGTLSSQIDLQSALDAKAPLASPALTGNPTAPTAAAGDNDTSIATTAFVKQETVGVQDLFIPAAAFWPRVTSGCSALTQTEIATSLINIQTLDFNQTTQQYAQTHYKFPKKYNLGTFTYEIEWTATTGTGSVVWGVAAVALADGDALTTALGTQVNVTDAAGTANTERNSATSAAVTPGNTPAVADGIYLQITRVTGDGSDDMAADAKFKGISIHITTNAATDA